MAQPCRGHMDLVSRVQGYKKGCYGQQAERIGGIEAGRRGVLPLSFPCLLHTYLEGCSPFLIASV